MNIQFTLLAAVFAICCAAPAASQTYPSKPIRVLVGFTPGGGGDISTRIVTTELEKTLGQPLIVENRPGANGALAQAQLARAEPDGYTLAMQSGPGDMVNFMLAKKEGKDLGFDIFKDFAPVGMLNSAPLFLVVHPSTPASNVREFIDLVKRKQGELNYATVGVGSAHHLLTELMNLRMGTKMTPVTYKAGADVMLATMRGETQATWVTTTQGLPNIRAGNLKALAISSAKRSSEAPEIPTMIEGGVPGFDAGTWFSIVAPARTSQPIINRLNAEINRINKTPQMQERLTKMGAVPLYGTPEDLGAMIKAEGEKWSGVLGRL